MEGEQFLIDEVTGEMTSTSQQSSNTTKVNINKTNHFSLKFRTRKIDRKV